MANELSLALYGAFAKSGLPPVTAGSTTPFSVTVAGDDYRPLLLTVSSTDATNNTAISYGDIGTAGWAFFKNLDSTYTIYLQTQTGMGVTTTADNWAELKPGEHFWVRLPTAAKQMGVYASGGTPLLQMLIVET